MNWVASLMQHSSQISCIFNCADVHHMLCVLRVYKHQLQLTGIIKLEEEEE